MTEWERVSPLCGPLIRAGRDAAMGVEWRTYSWPGDPARPWTCERTYYKALTSNGQ